MIRLTRTVRFCINSPSPADSVPAPATNSFAAFPSMIGLGHFYEMEVSCCAAVDPRTGYLVNIREIDNAVRAIAVPTIALATADSSCEPARVLAACVGPLDAALGGRLESARWRLTPYYSLQMTPRMPDTVLLRQQFEFAASHRLHSPALSDAENRAMFGKCNNPRGHGHNYRVEPCVEVPLGHAARIPFDLATLERLTASTLIERFDHKHLNEDTVEFSASTGLMPSVENIAAVCFRLLAPEVENAAPGARLRSVTVWETDKTSATFPG